MILICAWCKTEISNSSEKDLNAEITHGICDKCAIEIEYNRIPLNKVITE